MSETMDDGRRRILLGAAAVTAGLVIPRVEACAQAAGADEPHHHVIVQNSAMRIMRLLLRPGEATQSTNLRNDQVAIVLGDARVHVETQGGGGQASDVKLGTIDYWVASANQRVTNQGSTLFHAIVVDLLRPLPGHFGRAERPSVPGFNRVLDKPLARAWRLVLAPGEATAVYRQDGPGIRVILGGERLIDTRPGEIGHDGDVRPGDALFMLPAPRSLANAGSGPLDLIELELL